MVIKRVSPMSAAKVGGILGVILGLVVGACMSLFAMMAGSMAGAASSSESSMPMFGMAAFGAAAIVIVPIFYGVFVFITTLIYAALYNLAAKWVGGIEIDAA